jgi:hypothetical protein
MRMTGEVVTIPEGAGDVVWGYNLLPGGRVIHRVLVDGRLVMADTRPITIVRE